MTWVDIGLVVVRVAIGCWLLWSVRTVSLGQGPASRTAGQADDVAVIVPARDESGSIERLLGSIPDGHEVVVVDDDSSDDTADVARRAGARVLSSVPLPEAWIGKSWACDRGVAATGADTLVFVDADVRFGRGGLAAVLAAHRRHGGLVSVQPFHEPGGAVESLASIFNIVSYAGTDAGSPLGRWRSVRGAFGPVLATSRTDYVTAGGHESVQSSLLDDIALSDRYRAAGMPVTILAGGDAVRFRMYAGGFGPLLEGFTKNMAAGAESVRRTTTALLVVWLTLLVQAAAAPFVALALGDGLAEALVLYGVVALQYWWMARRLGRFGPVVALAFPAPLVLFLFVFARSALAGAAGTVSWKGRRVATKPPDDTRR